VIDYTREDFAKTGQTYDMIFDAVGKSSFSRCRGALKPNGIFVSTLPTLLLFLQMAWTSSSGGRKAMYADPVNTKEDLTFLKELIEAGELKAVIDRRYSWEQIAKAHRYVEKGHKKGNVVITLDHKEEVGND
jgi:NADPH:quinone reductase-like Zn-dependent oxidoreductase